MWRYFRFLFRVSFWLQITAAASTVLSVIFFAEALMAGSSQYFWLLGLWVLGSAAAHIEILVLEIVPNMHLMFTRNVSWQDPRLEAIVTQLLTHLGLRTKMKVGVKKNFSNAYYFAGKIVVGDKFLEKMSESEIAGALAHELAHKMRGHVWKKMLAIWILTIPTASLFVRYSWLPQILFYTAATAFLFLLIIPVNWYAEFDADKKAAEFLGVETMIATLFKLKEDHKDELSITHPTISMRIRRLQRKFGQAH